MEPIIQAAQKDSLKLAELINMTPHPDCEPTAIYYQEDVDEIISTTAQAVAEAVRKEALEADIMRLDGMLVYDEEGDSIVSLFFEAHNKPFCFTCIEQLTQIATKL